MLEVFKKKLILMYGKPAMTCFKYQVYLYGSEAITYLSVYKASSMSHQTAPRP
jgi:hypothetical protein